MTHLDADFVVFIRDYILQFEPGLDGRENRAALEGALGRIDHR